MQVPLTVSPYLSLPTATPLPYSYKSLPSTLPPSVIDSSSNTGGEPGSDSQSAQKAQYVVSGSGHAAHPDAIIQSCRALQDHLTKMQQDSTATLRKWQTSLQERELAEKRRVAPGWLDVDTNSRGLVPEKAMDKNQKHAETMDLMSEDLMDAQPTTSTDENELDRAFGGMKMQ